MADITDERLREIASRGFSPCGTPTEEAQLAAQLYDARKELNAIWTGGPLMRLTRTAFPENALELRTRFSCEILRRYRPSEMLVVDAVQPKYELLLASTPSDVLEFSRRKAFSKLADELYARLTRNEVSRG